MTTYVIDRHASNGKGKVVMEFKFHNIMYQEKNMAQFFCVYSGVHKGFIYVDGLQYPTFCWNTVIQ